VDSREGTLKHANETYGHLRRRHRARSFRYLGAQLTIYGAEINAVKKKTNLAAQPRGRAARRPEVFHPARQIEERRQTRHIRVSFDKSSRSK